MARYVTHRICEPCWREANPGAHRIPFRIRGDEAGPCCRCGNATSDGIYERGPAIAHEWRCLGTCDDD